MRLRLVPLLLALAGCTPAASTLPFPPASATDTPDPSKPGPFPVGVRTRLIEDTGRPRADGTPRQLLTEIWYPATAAAQGQPGASYDLTPLFTDGQRAQMADAGVTLPPLRTTAVRDAEPDREHGPYPVIVFAHGQGGVRWQSTFYTVALASHGYVVISPDHEGGTFYDLVRDGVQSAVYGFEFRPQDVIYLLNRFSRLPKGDVFEGLLDYAHVGVTGHSFGALTSLRVAALDARVKAIVPQAPTSTDIAWLGFDPKPVLTIPVQVQGARLDQTLGWDDHVAPAWADLKAPRWLLEVKTGGHFTFSDLCAFELGSLADKVALDIPGVNAADVRKVLADGCAPPAPAPGVAQPLMNHFALGFFNGHLRGSAASLAQLTQAKADALAPGAAAVTADP